MDTEAQRNALPVTGMELPDTDIERPLATVKRHHCQSYDDAYFRAADQSGDPIFSALFRSLGILCSFYPQYRNRAQPYRASWIDYENNTRSSTPDDLTDADLDIVAQLLPRAKSAALRARLADVLFLRRRSAYKEARAAIDDYLAAAQDLVDGRFWVQSEDLFYRAVQLAGQLGRQKPEFARAETALLEVLGHPLAQTELYFANHFLTLILGFGVGDPKTMADVALRHAEMAAHAANAECRRGYLLLEAEFRRMAGDTGREETARLEAAETYVDEATSAASGDPPAFLLASDSLARGIEALRQAHACDERVAELRKLLKSYQQQGRGELQTISIPIDRDAIEAIRQDSAKYVTNDDFRRAMILLALGVDVEKVDQLRKDTIEAIEQAPFTSLTSGALLDNAGRVVAHKQSLFGLTGDAAEQELEKRMFEHAREYRWRWRVDTFIEPARQQIWRQHRPSHRDLEYLVRHNPFIPPGHAGIYLQGLYAGLAGDFMISSHLLAPQLENSIRYVLEQNGIDVSNLNSDITQQVKTLGPLLDMPEMEKVFGKDLIFEMRGILIEKHGYSFRNDIAHGFLSEADCYGVGAVNLWWLALKLCHCTMILPDDLAEDVKVDQ